MFVYSLNNVNIRSSSSDSQSKPDLCNGAHIKALEVDALKLQMGDVAETPTTTFVDGDNNSRGNTAVETPVSREIYDSTFDIANFFSRPVEITSGTWAVDGELDVVFNPWNLWAVNARISNRLNNYKFFDGELCVKLVINGNPFAWGCLMMSYLPNSNPSFSITTDPRNFQPSTFFCDIMQASQRMHVLIDPTTSKGGELCLPLHSQYTGHNLTSTAFANVGEIWLRSINTLRQLGSTKPISYTVYAWAQKVKLSGPTQVNMTGLVAQAGGETEEGTLSQSLNLAARVASAATQMPVVGKWATAAEMAARLGADVASAFGYSRPLSQDVVKRTVRVAAHPFSVMDGLDTALPLGSEFNQNVTVDPETIGFGGGDEMNISKIAAIPSLVYVSNWLPSNTKNTLLCNFKVSPFISRSGTRSLINAQARQFTPAGMAALNFMYWRGTMRVRVQVVANSFHRGRLLVVWDPNLCNTSPQEQVVRNMIVDIAEQRDFSFDIGMCAATPMLFGLQDQGAMAGFEPSQAPQSDEPGYSNGVVSIYVLNELISNVTSTTPIQVNIWTSFVDFQGFDPSFKAASNMGLYPTAPTVALMADSEQAVGESEILEPQAGLIESDIFGNQAPDTHVLIQPTDKALPMGLHTGSAVESFRKIAKRWCFVRTETIGVTNTIANRFVAIREAIPSSVVAYGPGYTVSGWDGSGTNARKAIPLTPLVFNTQGYVFFRGGIRVAFRFKNGGSNFDVTVSRGYSTATLVRTITTDMDSDTFVSYKRAFDRSADGCIVGNNAGDMPTVAVEVPYAFARKMASTTLSTTATTTFESSAIFLDLDAFNNTATTRNAIFDQYMAAAEDFSLFWFRGCPCLYTYTPP